jgi:glucose-6-phosphate dehydrogenase assembly protein OpcA
MGMVMTLVIVVDEADAEDAMRAARAASHEHPARVLGVILGDSRGAGVVNAQVGTGQGWTGEHAMIRLKGEVVKHAESVVLPLLLPDSPVAIWWPSHPPADPAADPLGALAQRRITDAAAATHQKTRAIHQQCSAYAKGNTDLAWTRITPWRALLAAALDQHPLKVRKASVTAERISPSADLLAVWLNERLRVKVERHNSAGPGITEVVMETREGPIRITRYDGRLATFSSPGRPDRPIALKRRELHELLGEELRRLDEDDIYARVAKRLARKEAP